MEITLRPLPKQHLAYQALKTNKEVFFGGGAGGGKSWWLCETRLINAYLYPGYKSFIGRKELKRLMQSTYVTWQKVCKFHNIPQSEWKLKGDYNYIEFRNGSRIDLLDVSYQPSDPLFERFGSIEFTDGALEEAGEIDFLAYDVLKSRIGRHLNLEYNITPTLSITGNPKKNWTYKYFYKPWKTGTLPEGKAFIQSLYGDNKYTAASYGEQLSGLQDRVMIQRLRDGIWEYEDDGGTLIEYDAITDLWTNTVQHEPEKYLIGDIARYGADKVVLGLWQGLHCYKIVETTKKGLDETAALIDTLLQEHGIPRSRCLVDEDGVGSGVVDMLKGIKGFHNNASPLQELPTIRVREGHDTKRIRIRENYYNLKAQCGWKLADRINERLIKISTSDEKQKALLEEDLTWIRRKDPDSEGKLQLIPKDEIKKEIGRSPDYGDMILMRMWFELKGQRVIDPPKITLEEREFWDNKRTNSHHKIINL